MIDKQLKRKSPKVPWGWVIFVLVVSGLILWSFSQFGKSGNWERGKAIETVRPGASYADSPILGGIGKGSVPSSSSVLAKAPNEQSEAVFGGGAVAKATSTVEVQTTREVSGGGFFPPTATSVPEQPTVTLTPEILDTPTLTLTQEIVVIATETLEPTPTETETPMPTPTIKPVTPTPTDTPTPSATARPFSDRMKKVLDQGTEGIIGRVQSSVESAKNTLNRLPEAVKSASIPTLTLDQQALAMLKEVKDAESAGDWGRAESRAYYFALGLDNFSNKVREEYLSYSIELEQKAHLNASDPIKAWRYMHLAFVLSGSGQKGLLLIEIEDLLYQWHCQGKSIPSDILSKMGSFTGCR